MQYSRLLLIPSSLGLAIGGSRAASEATSARPGDHSSGAIGCETYVSIDEAPGATHAQARARVVVHYGEQSGVCRAYGTDGPSAFTFTVNGIDRSSYFDHEEQFDSWEAVADDLLLEPGAQNTLQVSFRGHDANGGPRTDVVQVQTTVAAIQAYPAEASPKRAAATVGAQSTNSQSFVVRNGGSSTATFQLSASCSGTASGCSVPSSITLAPGEAAPVQLTYTTGLLSTTGRVALVATREDASTVVDSGWVSVSASALSPALTADSLGTGELVERDLCLTIAAGSDAAYECGDLRLVHSLPAVRTMNKLRSPTLLYNSAHANPMPIVAAFVTRPTGSTVPDSVTGSVSVGGSVRAVGRWRALDWFTAGNPKRVALAFNASADTTGTYDATLAVSFWFDGQPRTASVTSKVPVVNRSSSAFGAGWWLAGLESLDPARMLWTGGDGSTRRYRPVSSTVWTATALDRPDTLKRDGTGWIRVLPNQVKVRFDSLGRHDYTENRLGHRTRFVYANGRLSGVRVPKPSGYLQYGFFYDANSGVLDSVSAPRPATSVPRTTKFTRSGGRLATIMDPDSGVVEFTYSASTGQGNRITVRKNRRGVPTVFTYDFGGKLAESRVRMYSNTSSNSLFDVITGFEAAESKGAPGPNVGLSYTVDTANTFTKLIGPRDNEADDTKFWIGIQGAPVMIENALGHRTKLRRGNAGLPALVTRLEHPNGRVLAAAYDAAGYPQETTDSSRFSGSPAQYATTRYQFDTSCGMATKIVPPMRDSTLMHYNADCNRDWQQDARGTPARVEFFYDSLTKLLRSTEMARGGADTIQYDALGNVARVASPLGSVRRMFADAIGRDTLVEEPVVDTLHNRSWVIRTRTKLDAMDRDTLIVRVAPLDSLMDVYGNHGTVSGHISRFREPTRYTRKRYDAEGNLVLVELDGVIRWGTSIESRVDPLKTRWEFDRLDRKAKEIAPDSAQDTYAYDKAGNMISWTTRRGHQITMTYDLVGRMTKRVVPQVSYARRVYAGDSMPHYKHKTNGQYLFGSQLTIPADTAVFTYDAAGNMLTAFNGDARVIRSYALDGQIELDSLQIRNYGSNTFTAHAYGIRLRHDLGGRRVSMRHPTQIEPLSPLNERGEAARDTLTRYWYSDWAALDSLRTPRAYVHRFFYDLDANLDSLHYGNGMGEKRTYDLEGKLTRALISTTRVKTGTYQDRGFGNGIVHDNTLAYDSRGKITLARDGSEYFEQYYTPSGELGRAEEGYRNGDLNVLVSSTITHVDALGNEYRRLRLGSGTADWAQDSMAYQRHTGRQLHIASLGPNGHHAPTTSEFDAAGNLHFTERRVRVGACSVQTSRCLSNEGAYFSYLDFLEAIGHYYSADNKLRVTDRNTKQAMWYPAVGGLEEYRYDALGRRVMRRFRSDCRNVDGNCEFTGEIYRYVYDGDQILYEITNPGADSSTTAEVERGADLSSLWGDANWARHGIVEYAHGRALDRPLSATRIDMPTSGAGSGNHPGSVIFLHQNWRGLFDQASLWDTTNADGSLVFWFGRRMNSNLDRNTAGTYEDDEQRLWFGSLLDVQRDGTNQVYMRNRYYDPASARFTQEDPIGLAGGLNLYGFAKGDPVNFSDPFGLCPDCIFDGIALGLDIADIRKNGLTWGRGVALAVDVLAAAVPLVPAGAGVTMRAVRAAGRAGEEAAGIVKNTERIVSRTGTAAYRVPDGLTSTTLTEVKNVSKLGLTNQLRDFAAHAKEKGLAFELVIRKNTELTKPLQEFIRENGVTVRYLK